METFFLNLGIAPEQLEYVIQMTDAIVFLLFAICVGYLFLFAFNSLGKSRFNYAPATKKQRFIILIPAYREDRSIVNTIKELFNQDYPRDKFDVMVIAENMEESVNRELEEAGIIVLRLREENRFKTLSLQTAVEYIDFNKLNYDIVVMLDTDNTVDPDFLDRLNDAFYSGCSVVQTHRVAKNLNTSIAVLDALSEEMNNNIFRKGHTHLGFSSCLIGSGMAFEYDIFKNCIMEASPIGVNKQIEMLLLRDNTFIEYLGTVYTYDEKTKNSSQFSNQRRRWIANQFHNLLFGLKSLPAALLQGNWDYANKMFQWMLPSRVLLLGMIVIISLITSYYDLSLSLKWWGLLGVLVLTFAIAIPDHLIDKKLIRAILNLPLIFLMTFLKLFRINGEKNKDMPTKYYE